jgi:hypothetical protein
MSADKPKEIQVTEDDILDFALQYMYNNLSKNEVHFEKEIIASTKINLEEHQKEHLRELLLNTSLVQASIGFGKEGKMYLNATGIAIMKQYKSYKIYLASKGQAPIQIVEKPNIANKTKPKTKPNANNIDFINTVGEDD